MRMKGIYEDSAFAYEKGRQLSLSQVRPDKAKVQKIISEKVSEKTYSSCDMAVINALYKFGILNSYNLTRYLQHADASMLKESERRKDFSKNLRKLEEDGVIEKYTRDGADKEKKEAAYILSEGAVSWMRENGNEAAAHDLIELCKCTEDDKLLELLSLNQYHISILSEYRGRVKEGAYHKKVTFGQMKTLVPSKLKINVSNPSLTIKKIVLYAVVMPKKNPYTDEFIATLITLNSYIRKNYVAGELPFIVIICEGKDSIQKLLDILSEHEEMKDMEMLYMTELATKEDNPLKDTIRAKVSERGNEYILSTINMLKLLAGNDLKKGNKE